jgi:hypothetical protein
MRKVSRCVPSRDHRMTITISHSAGRRPKRTTASCGLRFAGMGVGALGSSQLITSHAAAQKASFASCVWITSSTMRRSLATPGDDRKT